MINTNSAPHKSVLLDEVIEALALHDGGIYVDGTFGAGGYTSAILENANCKVIGIDRDPLAQKFAAPIAAKYHDRFTFIQGRFADMAELVKEHGVNEVDGAVFDIGVSSMQIDNPERGFSFQKDGELDMRMSAEGQSAADVVNTKSEQELADIIFTYGEERHSRAIAKKIVSQRKEKPITRTLELAQLVATTVPHGKDGINPATRTFQALRIYVNDEMNELGKGLNGALSILKPQGRLAVVSFHSLEDRIVKSFMQDKAGLKPSSSRHLPPSPAKGTGVPALELITKKPVLPSAAELADNPRSRSAKLRVAAKTQAEVPL